MCRRIDNKDKRLAIGSVITWDDPEPLNSSGKLELDGTVSLNDAQLKYLYRKYGFQANEVFNLHMKWLARIEMIFTGVSKGENLDRVESCEFDFHGTIFPASDKFLEMRDKIVISALLENESIPDGKKSKGVFKICRFTIRAVAV